MCAYAPLPHEAKLAFDRQILAVLESIDAGFMSLDLHCCFLYANRAAESMLHKKREDLLGKNIWEVFPEVVGTVFWKKYYQATGTQTIIDVEDVFPPTGTWFALRIYPSEAGLTVYFHETTEHNESAQDGQRHEQGVQLQASLIELAHDAIIVRDPASIIVSWNRGAEQLYGWTAQEAIGNLTHELLQTRFPGSRQALDRFLAAGEQWEGELVHMRKDGTQVIVESRQVVTHDAQNRPLAILEINRDITGRKQRERENQEQNRQLVALVESSDIPIIGKTRGGIITSWNRAAERMYGYSAQEAVCHPITLIFPPDRQDESARIMEQIIRGERVDLYETTRRRKDGTILPVSVTISPIHDSEGHIVGASDISHDITERKRAEEQEHFLAEVSKVLSSTLDYQETLANVARLVVPQLADWFAVDLVDAGGHFELIEIAHKDPEQVRWARKLRERYPIDPDTSAGAPNVVRTGRAELYPEITDEMLVAAARNEEELAIARQIGYTSVMLVPLMARGKTSGVVTFVSSESGRKYDERDLALAEEVGRRAGVAIDNARLYREAQQSRDQLDIILQGVADGIVVYASDSQIMYANEAAAQMTGYGSVQEMLAAQQLAILSRYEIIDEQGQSFPRSQLPHRRVFAGEREAQAIIGYREIGAGQSGRWSLVKSRPVLDERREVTMVVTIIHDITQRMIVERRKDEFIGMTSHELKTPVTSLKGFTNVLQRRLAKQGDAQGLHYLARMDAQLNKLTKLVSDLLDISRMQSGKLALRAEPFDLDTLIDETVENVQAATSTHHLRIEGRTGAQVFGDQERLGQVFINLLTNAIKYSPRADTVMVRLWRDRDPEQVIVSVQDSGIGIDKSHHQHIFERFYQVTDPEEKTYPGLGIGLYISSEIVARHHGRMWVESSKGEGATFFVALPLFPQGEQAGLL
ncbi:MAG TPA: PAS domain S-box protein [Ktedonobacteraceae bacterium]